MNEFSRLFSPFRIGTLEVKNRLVLAPMSSELGTADGAVSPELLHYYEERARGGVGLIIVEATYVDRRGRRLPHNLMIDDDRFVTGLKELAQRIKEAGARACLQLNHGGRACPSSVAGGPPLAPSRIPAKAILVSPQSDMPEELTLDQIRRIIQAFIAAAVRAREAGFEAVEIHGAHGYLISNFLSPEANHRTDLYGGNICNRARLYEEIVKGVKARLGHDFPLIARLNCRDYLEGGLEFPDAVVAAQMVEKVGADAIHLSGGVHSSEPPMIAAPMSVSPGVYVEYAAQMKQKVKVPVITVNRVHDPVLAENILERGAADVVAMGRPLLADPHLPYKAMRGDIKDIVPCISCLECSGFLYGVGRIGCAVNPFAGQELALKDKIGRKRSPKRVVVVGGGVAGMACAVGAARLNHRVTLFERQNFLGGLLRMAMLAPNRDTLPRLLAYFENQVQTSGVEVQLGRALTLAEARELGADVFVVATGATPFVPPLPGVDGENVVLGIDALQDPNKVGQRCIIYGGGLLAVELADLLMTGNGRQLVLISRSDILKKANLSDRLYYMGRLRDSGVEVLRNTQIVEIQRTSVVVEPANHWKREILDVDTVMIATGWKPLGQLAEELSASGFRTMTLGDAVEPRKLLNAIRDGTLAALDI